MADDGTNCYGCSIDATAEESICGRKKIICRMKTGLINSDLDESCFHGTYRYCVVVFMPVDFVS